MSGSPLSPHLASPAELQERLATERAGEPFIVYRDSQGSQRIVSLGEGSRLTIGRSPKADIALTWDEEVSGLHAELSQAGDSWLILDDGLSRNGTHVNGERVQGRRRLRDNDQMVLGQTALIYREPLQSRLQSTAVAGKFVLGAELSRRSVACSCLSASPSRTEVRSDDPATNQQIADDLHLSVAAVKAHLRLLFERFQVEDLPQNDKRAALVELALTTGTVSPGEL